MPAAIEIIDGDSLRAIEARRGEALRPFWRQDEFLTIITTGPKHAIAARGGMESDHADHLLVVPSQETPRIQEVHLLWAHAWCEAVDHAMQEQG